MGSHSVTYHQTHVNVSRHNYSQTATRGHDTGTRFTDPRGMESWVDLSGWYVL